MIKEIFNKEFEVNNISKENKKINANGAVSNLNHVKSEGKINKEEMALSPKTRVTKKPPSKRSRTQLGAYRKKRSDAGKKKKRKSFWEKFWGL